MKLVSVGSISPNTVGLSRDNVPVFHAITYGNIGMCMEQFFIVFAPHSAQGIREVAAKLLNIPEFIFKVLFPDSLSHVKDIVGQVKGLLKRLLNTFFGLLPRYIQCICNQLEIMLSKPRFIL